MTSSRLFVRLDSVLTSLVDAVDPLLPPVTDHWRVMSRFLSNDNDSSEEFLISCESGVFLQTPWSLVTACERLLMQRIR
jgi:hypothetical protein